MSSEPNDNAVAELDNALASFRKLVRPLVDIHGLKMRGPEATTQLEKALGQLQSGVMFGTAIDEVRTQIEHALIERRRAHTEAFRRHEAAFIRASRDANVPHREQNEGWRVGPLELQFQRGQARARALYNHEELVGWAKIEGVDDLEKLERQGRTMLDRAALPDDLLISVMLDAYKHVRTERAAGRLSSLEDAPIIDFYREVRIALVRHDLMSKRPEAKLSHAELPKWAFLYNLDRYRALGSAVSADRRLGFQTGSQAQSSRGQCLTLNGLDALQDYKEFCYIVGPREATP